VSIFYLVNTLKKIVLFKYTLIINFFTAWAYKMTKNISRQPTIQLLIDNKQKDFDFVFKYMQTSMVQKNIGLYLQSLKKK
jgi:hypothetical protein